MLDVARFKYPPHWVPVERLWAARCALDSSTQQPRGYWLVDRSDNSESPIGLKALVARLGSIGAPLCPPTCSLHEVEPGFGYPPTSQEKEAL
nr:phytochelatin synthase family protein [Rhodoferax sp.]